MCSNSKSCADGIDTFSMKCLDLDVKRNSRGFGKLKEMRPSRWQSGEIGSCRAGNGRGCWLLRKFK